MERQGLCDPRLDSLGQASAVGGVLFAAATVIKDQCKDQRQEQEVEQRGDIRV